MYFPETGESIGRPVGFSVLGRPVSQEAANQMTHALGLAASVVGAVVLIQNLRAGANARQVIGCGVYGASLIFVYAASTLSHSFRRENLRNFFRMLDQICIFLFMAGSFTAFALVHMSAGLWWTILAATWLMAAVGIMLRINSNNRSLSPLCFLPLAWMPVLAIGHIAEISGGTGLALVLVGGLLFMAGVWFLANDERAPYFHAIWHLLVIGGSICHYLFLLRFVAMWPVQSVS